MELCISTLACPGWTLEQIIQALVQNGISGIDFRGLGSEIDITKLPAFTTHLDQTLGQLWQHSLSMPCLNTSITLVTPAADRWEMMLDECSRYSHLAARSQTKFLRIFGGSPTNHMDRDEARSLARRHLRQIVKICQSHQCIPLLETHDAWATGDEVLELLHEFSTGEVGALWDFEHSWRKGEPLSSSVEMLGKWVRHVHIKDSVRVEDKNLPRLLGEGQLPLVDVLKALKSISYSGWLCLETEKRWHPEAPEPEESIPQFARWMQEHLATI